MKVRRFLFLLTWLVPLCLCLSSSVEAQLRSSDKTLSQVYGASSGCVYVGDIDDGDADVTAQLTAGMLYTVFCYDSATFEGVACRIKQGASTVSAATGEGATGEGELLFAGEKKMVYVTTGYDYISFEPLADGTTQIGVACPQY